MNSTCIFRSATIIGLLVLVSTANFSCKRKGCMDELATNWDGFAKVDDGTCEFKLTDTLGGFVTEDKRLNNETTWVLSGWCHVKSGVVLTIEPGTKIIADPNEATDYLLIEQGGKIKATGTAAEPIIFTSGKDTPQAGDWGGLILCGNAPGNTGNNAKVLVNDATYGGTKTDESSGELSYVVVAYAGNEVGAAVQYDAISFYGVGSGTQINHIQATRSAADGIGIYGGTFNAAYLYSNNNASNQLQWNYGYTGALNYVYCEMSTVTGEGALVGQNNVLAPAATPVSNPTLNGVSLISNGAKAPNDALVHAVELGYGTKAQLQNVFIEYFSGIAVLVRHDETIANVEAGSLAITDIKAGSVGQEQYFVTTSGFEVFPVNSFVFGTTADGAGSAWLNGWVLVD